MRFRQRTRNPRFRVLLLFCLLRPDGLGLRLFLLKAGGRKSIGQRHGHRGFTVAGHQRLCLHGAPPPASRVEQPIPWRARSGFLPSLSTDRSRCSCSAADLRAHADRRYPGRRCPSALAAWESSASVCATLFCISGFDGRLPSWRISTVLVHLLLGPSSLVHVCVDHLADAVAEHAGTTDKNAQRSDEDHNPRYVRVGALVAQRSIDSCFPARARADRVRYAWACSGSRISARCGSFTCTSGLRLQAACRNRQSRKLSSPPARQCIQEFPS